MYLIITLLSLSVMFGQTITSPKFINTGKIFQFCIIIDSGFTSTEIKQVDSDVYQDICKPSSRLSSVTTIISPAQSESPDTLIYRLDLSSQKYFDININIPSHDSVSFDFHREDSYCVVDGIVFPLYTIRYPLIQNVKPILYDLKLAICFNHLRNGISVTCSKYGQLYVYTGAYLMIDDRDIFEEFEFGQVRGRWGVGLSTSIQLPNLEILNDYLGDPNDYWAVTAINKKIIYQRGSNIIISKYNSKIKLESHTSLELSTVFNCAPLRICSIDNVYSEYLVITKKDQGISYLINPVVNHFRAELPDIHEFPPDIKYTTSDNITKPYLSTLKTPIKYTMSDNITTPCLSTLKTPNIVISSNTQQDLAIVIFIIIILLLVLVLIGTLVLCINDMLYSRKNHHIGPDSPYKEIIVGDA